MNYDDESKRIKEQLRAQLVAMLDGDTEFDPWVREMWDEVVNVLDVHLAVATSDGIAVMRGAPSNPVPALLAWSGFERLWDQFRETINEVEKIRSARFDRLLAEMATRMSDDPTLLRSCPDIFESKVIAAMPDDLTAELRVVSFFAYVRQRMEDLYVRLGSLDVDAEQAFLNGSEGAWFAHEGGDIEAADPLAAQAEHITSFLSYLDDQLEDLEAGDRTAVGRIDSFLEHLEDGLGMTRALTA